MARRQTKGTDLGASTAFNETWRIKVESGLGRIPAASRKTRLTVNVTDVNYYTIGENVMKTYTFAGIVSKVTHVKVLTSR